jgi:hypothetical protein
VKETWRSTKPTILEQETTEILKRNLSLLFIIMFLVLGAKGQTDINGKWYTIARNRVIQITISKDSIVSRQLTWELAPWPNNKPVTSPIDTIIRANGNLYYCISVKTDSLPWLMPLCYRVLAPGKKILSAANHYDSTLFNKKYALEQYIRTDTGKKYGMIYFSETELLRLKALPSIDSIRKEDFKLFCNRVIEFKEELKKLEEKVGYSNDLLYYGYFTIHNIIGEIGYNPLVPNKQFDKMFERFEKDSELKALIDEMKR